MLKAMVPWTVVVCVIAGLPAAGSTPAAAPSTCWSHNGRWALHIDESAGLTLRHHTGEAARTVWIRGFPQRAEGMPSPPRNAYVTDDGRHVVLCGVCSRAGVGEVLAILGAGGELVARYTLRDLFADDELAQLRRMDGACGWFEATEFIFLAGGTQFCMVTQMQTGGTLRVFDLNTGRRLELLASADDRSAHVSVADGGRAALPPAPVFRRTADERTISTMYLLLVATGALALSLLMYALDKKYA